jgi:hypothetical protein
LPLGEECRWIEKWRGFEYDEHYYCGRLMCNCLHISYEEMFMQNLDDAIIDVGHRVVQTE